MAAPRMPALTTFNVRRLDHLASSCLVHQKMAMSFKMACGHLTNSICHAAASWLCRAQRVVQWWHIAGQMLLICW